MATNKFKQEKALQGPKPDAETSPNLSDSKPKLILLHEFELLFIS